MHYKRLAASTSAPYSGDRLKELSDQSIRRPHIRTYSGKGNPQYWNDLARAIFAKGDRSFSLALDHPTQLGLDIRRVSKGETRELDVYADARVVGTVGQIGTPIQLLRDAQALLEGLPLDQINMSQTINQTAIWLGGLYHTVARMRGFDTAALQGTFQNDVIKEAISRGTINLPVEKALGLSLEFILWGTQHLPRMRKINVCGYHIEEAGANEVQTIAYTMHTAIRYLDPLYRAAAEGRITRKQFETIASEITFFMSAGKKLFSQIAKFNALADLWHQTLTNRYGIPPQKGDRHRFTFGVQTDSISLQANYPVFNFARIMLGILSATLGGTASIQTPPISEAYSIPSVEEQWLMRLFQETILEESDILANLAEARMATAPMAREFKAAAEVELERVLAIENLSEAIGVIRGNLTRVMAARDQGIESGAIKVVGRNFKVSDAQAHLPHFAGIPYPIEEVATSDLVSSYLDNYDAAIAARDASKAERCIDALREAARKGEPVMPAILDAIQAGVAVGEGFDVLREVWGTYQFGDLASADTRSVIYDLQTPERQRLRERVSAFATRAGRQPRILLTNVQSDGHNNALRQLTAFLTDHGFTAECLGLFQTPDAVVKAAIEGDVHIIGISEYGNAYRQAVPRILELLAEKGSTEIKVVLGGIVHEEDRQSLRAKGVAAIFPAGQGSLIEIAHALMDILEK